MSDHQVVAAFYDEPPEWIEDLPHIIYHKGIVQPNPKLNIVRISENHPSRESHTYLYHIINKWDELAEWTAFIQGYPFDHCNHSNFNWLAEPELGFCYLANKILQDDRFGQPHHITKIPLGEFYEALFKSPAPRLFTFGAGCQFVAHRDIIKSRPIEFYKRVLELNYRDPPESIIGVMERMWIYILGIDPTKIPLTR